MLITNYKETLLTAKENKTLTPLMASWRTVHPAVKAMEDTTKNVDLLSKMISWELANPEGARRMVLVRLHMKLNAMRNRLEYTKLVRHATR